ncbi:hypothetical protein KIL84_018079, partial [Mauremys mutica]
MALKETLPSQLNKATSVMPCCLCLPSKTHFLLHVPLTQNQPFLDLTLLAGISYGVPKSGLSKEMFDHRWVVL